MRNHKSQNLFLQVTDDLNIQLVPIENPCFALLFSRQYRLLAATSIDENQQQEFTGKSRLWLKLYIYMISPSQEMQYRLNDLILFNEANQLT